MDAARPVGLDGTPRPTRSVFQAVGSPGFTYVNCLVLLVVVSIVSIMHLEYTSKVVQRENEQELLHRGLAYLSAIRSYYEAGNPVKTYPARVEDLLQDPRFLHKRHLRRQYKDPITHKDFRVVLNSDLRIIGVVSESRLAPFKQTGFPKDIVHFSASKTYSDWTFVYFPVDGSY